MRCLRRHADARFAATRVFEESAPVADSGRGETTENQAMSLGRGWALKIRFWIHRHGEKVLGPGRAELLEHIDRHHSIAAAAKQMKMSYRRAWGLVRSMNQAAGTALVEVATGGLQGGGANLTPHGWKILSEYQRIATRLARAARPNRSGNTRA